MTNIAVIKQIEYNRSGVHTQIDFQNGSAAYECKQSVQAPGNLYKHTLTFKIAPISPENESILNEASQSGTLRLTDVNGLKREIGSYDIPLKYEVDEAIDGKPGSWRGYKITVKWDSDTRGKSFI